VTQQTDLSADEAEQALVRAAQAGDKDAFARLLQSGLYIIHAIVRGKVAPRDVEDVEQRVYLAVWAGFSGFHGTGSFRAWLRAVARGVVADYHRHADPVAPESLIGEFVAYPETQATLDRVEDREVIDAALDRLHPRHQAALLLRLREGLSFAEVGKRLNISEEAARVLFHRAKSKLRQEEV